jgi:chemotaxis protein methyltransferase CheR
VNNDYLEDDTYHRFQYLVLARTGMILGQKRRSALARGVLRLADRVTGGDLEKYYNLLSESETETSLWNNLIEEITIGETYFFRDTSQMQALRHHVLPRIIDSHSHDRTIRIWSAGCASGEEPFTLAILLSEMIAGIDSWNIFILATDINRKFLAKGKAASYRSWSSRQTDPAIQTRYCQVTGDSWEMIPPIRKMVHFAYLNLSGDCYPSLSTNTGVMDLILCRNVAIYHSEPVFRHVVDRMYRCLIPGGWLMVGAAETSIPVFSRFKLQYLFGSTLFQKTGILPGAFIPAITVTDRNPTNFSLPLHTFHDKESVAGDIENLDVLPEQFQSMGAVPTDQKARFDQGQKLVQEKRYEEAIEIFRSIPAADDNHVDSIYQMARIYANIGKMEESRICCEKVLVENPLNTEAHYTLALTFLEMGDMTAAFDELKRVLFLDPGLVLGHFSMAAVCRQLDQKEKSGRHLRQAIKLASFLEPDCILPGSDDLTAGQMLTMARMLKD